MESYKVRRFLALASLLKILYHHDSDVVAKSSQVHFTFS